MTDVEKCWFETISVITDPVMTSSSHEHTLVSRVSTQPVSLLRLLLISNEEEHLICRNYNRSTLTEAIKLIITNNDLS